jgi:hypothetical protein
VQLDEHGDLRTQHVGVERLEDVVDGAGRVAAEDLFLLLRDRGDEDDRYVACSFALLDQSRSLEPVENRHLDVEQDDGDLVAQQLAQRVLTRVRGEKRLLERLEDRLECEQILRPVVDEQDVRHQTFSRHSP